MQRFNRFLHKAPLHTLLLPVFFVLYNILELDNYVTLAEVAISLGVLLPSGFALAWLGKRFFRCWQKAAISSTLLLLVLLFYRDAYYALDDVFGSSLRHRYMVPALALCWLSFTILLKIRKASPTRLNHYLNVLLLLVVVLEIGRVGANHFTGRAWKSTIALEGKHPQMPKVEVKNRYPDVYFILLDAYTNPNSLKTWWDYDNKEFLRFLKSNHFKWQKQAISNYNVTQYSMASMLNMEYLPDLWAEVDNNISWETILRVKINNSEVARQFALHGYDVVNYSLFDVAGQPHYIDYDYLNFHGLSLHEHLFKKSLPGKIYADTYFSTLKPTRGRELMHKLAEESKRKTERSRFVYTHLIMPHRPYYFDAEGNLYEHGLGKFPDDPTASYLEQLNYTNTLVTETVEQILENTGGDCVIILQGDHGYRGFRDTSMRDKEGYSTLNAVYFPDHGCTECYPEVSGVNVFRVVLNELFRLKLPYLEDYPDKRMHKDHEPGADC